MPFYKNQTNTVYFLESSDLVGYLPDGVIEISESEANDLRSYKDAETLSAEIRLERDERFSKTGWIIERHKEQLSLGIATSITEVEYSNILKYRQNLRDIPKQEGFPMAVIWPTPPTICID